MAGKTALLSPVLVAPPTLSFFLGCSPSVVEVWQPERWAEVLRWIAKPQPWLGKDRHRGISLATFRNRTRSLANVEHACGLVYDFDERDGRSTNKTELRQFFSRARLTAIGHTSKSHTSDSQRWRIFVPLAHPITASEYRTLSEELSSTMPVNMRASLDPQSASPAQLYWAPAARRDHPYVTFSVASNVLHPAPWLQRQKASQGGVRQLPKLVPNGDASGMFERARLYLAKMEPSVQGQNGSRSCFRAAMAMRQRFQLSEQETLSLLLDEFNPRCEPPWSPLELQHKIRSADPTRTRSRWEAS